DDREVQPHAEPVSMFNVESRNSRHKLNRRRLLQLVVLPRFFTGCLAGFFSQLGLGVLYRSSSFVPSSGTRVLLGGFLGKDESNREQEKPKAERYRRAVDFFHRRTPACAAVSSTVRMIAFA